MRGYPRAPLSDMSAGFTVAHVYASGGMEYVRQVIRASEPPSWWRRDSLMLIRQDFWAHEPAIGERVGEVLVLWERSIIEEVDACEMAAGRRVGVSGDVVPVEHRRHGGAGGA